MLESVFLQLESVGLQHLIEPIIDTTYFGCQPDNVESCIIYGSAEHDLLNFLLSPVLFLSVGIAVFSGLLVKVYKNRRKTKIKTDKPSYAEKIKAQQNDMLEAFGKHRDGKKQRKSEKKEFLKTAYKGFPETNPQKKYLDWVAALDPEHPQTAYIQAVHAETKEIVTPEQKVLEQQVEKIMTEEHISEDKAVDKVVKQLETETVKLPEQPSRIVEKPSGETIDLFHELKDDGKEEKDLFRQDIKPKQYPKRLVSLQKKLKLKRKEKQVTRSVLTDLGKTRRDQYAEQIEKRLLLWALPLPEYKGKNSEIYQKSTQDVLLAVKKLALFCSMAEFMKDKKRKKKRYWRNIPVGE